MHLQNDAINSANLISNKYQRSALAVIARYFGYTWVRCLILIVVGIIVRAPALQGELIWDDSFLARDNPFIKSPLLILEVFRHPLLVDSVSAHYRPVQNISYMFDYFVWNMDTYGFHLSNIVWHVASAVLLYFLLCQLLAPITKKFEGAREAGSSSALCKGTAFLIALLWVVHPVHSAAVDYISGRADSLAFFFSSAAWLLFLHGQRSTRFATQALLRLGAAFFLLLGLCSRESACMWALMFLIHLFFFERRTSFRRKAVILAVCLGIVGIYAGLRSLPERRSSSDLPTNGWSAQTRGVLMLRALGDYGRLMLFPSNLHMERTVVNSAERSNARDWRHKLANESLTFAGVVVAAGLTIGACRKGRARTLRALGAVWFILSYLPISNLFELNATVAEHWLYLPSVGFLMFLAGCYLELSTRARSYATAFACVAAVALGARSYVRSTDWLTAEQFYRRTIEAGGGSIRVVLNLGHIYSTKGDYARAEAFYRKALALCPTYIIASNNLADVLRREGKLEEAEQVYHSATAMAPEARKEFPRTWVVALNIANFRVEENRTDEALEVLAEARREYPGVWPLISFESEQIRKSRGPAAAIAPVEEYARSNWWHLPSQVALGKLYWEMGDVAHAEDAFRRASRLDIHDVSSLNMIALLNVNQSHFDEAYRVQRRAIARQPDEPRQYLILSDILEKMGRGEEARAMIAQVSRMKAMAGVQTAAN